TVSGRRRAGSGDGYAIPMNNALAIAQQIVDGKASATVHIGPRAILGVNVGQDSTSSGVVVAGVQEGGPAAAAGRQTGDVITKIHQTEVSSLTDLQNVLGGQAPGAKVDVTWTTSAGRTQSASVTLGEGPPA